jgi:hypothetical protein
MPGDKFVKGASADCVAPVATAPAPVPVAASPAEAVAQALQGTAVKLAIDGGEARGLAIRELIPRGEQRAFEVGLAGQRFEVVVPAATDATALLARVLPMAAKLPAAVQQDIRRITIQDPSPATIAYTTELAQANGPMQAIEVRRKPDGDKATFTISAKQGAFELTMPAGPRESWAVAQAFHLWAEIPPAMRGVLHQVRIEPGANPQDEEWAKTYNSPGFKSAATGGNGQTTFWSGTDNLQEEYFLHEFGHVLGQTYSSKNAMTPDGWDEAIAADNAVPTDYAKSSPAEDFAESFWLYLTLRNGQVPRYMPFGPKNPAEFTQRYPRRAAILDAIFDGKLARN